MAVASSDLVVYLSANRPEDDTSTSGGAIDTTMRLLDRSNTFNLNAGSGDQIDLVSDAAGDTQNCVLAGYGTDGSWIEETITLTGMTNVQSTNTFLHLLKVELASAATGTVTVAEYNAGSPSTIFTIPATEKGAAALFLKATAEAAGGSSKDFYEKVFYENTHATDALTSGVVWLSEDEDAELTMDCEKSGDVTTTDGNETTTNRVTEPTTGGTYAWGEHATEGAGHDIGDAEDGNLVADEGQGIWVKLTLAAGRTPEAPVQFTLDISGAAT